MSNGVKRYASEEYVKTLINEFGKPVVDISNLVVDNQFNFSEVESGLYWSDKNIAFLRGDITDSFNNGLFSVLKLTDTISNVYSVNGNKQFLYINGSITTVKEDLRTDVDYNELTTTDKTITGAINELNAKHTEGTDSLILLSPNGTKFSITVGDDGVLTTTEIETTE